MNARHVLLMAGLMGCLVATGWADDGRHRAREGDRPDHRHHQIAPGGWPQRHWHDDRHERHGSFWFIQPYEGVRPFVYPYQPPHVIVPPPPAFYWYCPDPAGYYPYVQYCNLVWQRVPATRWP